MKTDQAAFNLLQSMRFCLACVLVVCAFACGVCAGPRYASALEVEKLTAQPNADSGSDVLGGEETRLTWEVQPAADESIAQLEMILPEQTDCDASRLRVTMLSGEDLMERQFLKPEVSCDGRGICLAFSDHVPAGRFLRVELYGVVFPSQGGNLKVGGSYVLADGSHHEVGGMPSVKVKKTGPIEAIERFLEDQPWVQAWNSNTFLRLFLNPLIVVSSLPVIFSGFLMALAIVLVAFPVAIPFGFILALMRISKLRVLRALASIYVNLIRGTPAFLQIYIAFFGLPLAGINIDNYPLGVIVMAMNSAAYLCEIFRAGIQSIPKGQTEAARSLGMNAAQTMVSIIVPQTFRNVIPTLTSEFILLFKDTSLLAAVGVMEIVMYAKTIVATTGSITPYVVAALFYLVVTLPLAQLVSRLEARLTGNDLGVRKKRPLKSTGVVVATPADHIAGL